MQNTASGAQKPLTLLENFFIAGVSQGQLIEELRIERTHKDMIPQILFSMYTEAMPLEAKVQYIFPKKISILPGYTTPHFHSFINENNGYQSYFHVLTFYEEISIHQVNHDIDVEGCAFEMQMQKARKLAEAYREQQREEQKANESKVSSFVTAHQQVLPTQQNQSSNSSDKTFATRSVSELQTTARQQQKAQRRMLETQTKMAESKNKPMADFSGKDIMRATHTHGPSTEGSDNIKKKKKKFHNNASGMNFGGFDNDMIYQSQCDPYKIMETSPSPQKKINGSFIALDRTTNYDKMINDQAKSHVTMLCEDQLKILSGVKNEKKCFEREMTSIQKSCNYGHKCHVDDKSMRQSTYRSQASRLKSGVANRHTKMKTQALMMDLKGYELENVSDVRYNAINDTLYSASTDNLQPHTPAWQNTVLGTEMTDETFSDIAGLHNSFAVKLDKSHGTDIHAKQQKSRQVPNEEPLQKQSSMKSNSSGSGLSELKKHWRSVNDKLTNKYYVPVAFVIETKAEFHDHFKLILQLLYEKVIQLTQMEADEGVPESIRSHFSEEEIHGRNSSIPELNRCMVFAELVTHLAFLRTIPAPVFNSEVSLVFCGKAMSFKEESLSCVPMKNHQCVRILTECLDFQTILTCVKALLFDMNLIVFSEDVSLLFNVVEALKQLMFPFTYDSKQFLPANDQYKDSQKNTLKDIFVAMEGVHKVIFAIQTGPDADFETFMEYQDSVVVDVDMSIAHISTDLVDSRPLPRFPNEHVLIRTLNLVKNEKLPHYGKVYVDEEEQARYREGNGITATIRRTFFDRCFRHFLEKALDSIKVPASGQVRMFSDFFSVQDFIERNAAYDDDSLEPTDLDYKQFERFAERLADSASFVHFMEGYLEDDITNFDIAARIILKRKKRSKAPAVTSDRFYPMLTARLGQLEDEDHSLIQRHIDIQKQVQTKSFRDESVFFNFILPSYNQQLMLFEKIQYFIDDANLRANEFDSAKDVDRKHTTQNQLVSMLRRIFRSLQDSKLQQFAKSYEDVFGPGLSIDFVSPELRKTNSSQVPEVQNKLALRLESIARRNTGSPEEVREGTRFDTFDPTQLRGLVDGLRLGQDDQPEEQKKHEQQETLGLHPLQSVLDRKSRGPPQRNLSGHFGSSALIRTTSQQKLSSGKLHVIHESPRGSHPEAPPVAVETVDDDDDEGESRFLKLMSMPGKELQRSTIVIAQAPAQKEPAAKTVFGDSQEFALSETDPSEGEENLKSIMQRRTTQKMRPETRASQQASSYQAQPQDLLSANHNTASTQSRSNLMPPEKLVKKSTGSASSLGSQRVPCAHALEQQVIQDDLVSQILTKGQMKPQELLSFFREAQAQEFEEEGPMSELLCLLESIMDELDKAKRGSMLYGKRGLLEFLANLFLNFTDAERHKINFYFTISEQIVEFVERRKTAINSTNSRRLHRKFAALQEAPEHDISVRPDMQLLPKKMERSDDGAADCHDYQLLHSNRYEAICQSKRNGYDVFTNAEHNTQAKKKDNDQQSDLLGRKNTFYKNQQHNAGPARTHRKTFYDLKKPLTPLKSRPVEEDQTPKKVDLASVIQMHKLAFDQLDGEFDQAERERRLLKELCPVLRAPLTEFELQDVWFWIEYADKEDDDQNGKKVAKSAGKEESGLESMSYQEILTLIKMVDHFENKNCSHGMILQLLMQFPTFHFNFSKELESQASQVRSKSSMVFKTSERSSHAPPPEKKIVAPNTVLEAMFPLDQFLFILDSLNRQQLIDLFGALSGDLGLREFRIGDDEDTNMFYNQHISMIDVCYKWTINNRAKTPNAICSGNGAQISQDFDKEYGLFRFYNSLPEFLVQLRFEMALRSYHADLSRDRRSSSLVHRLTTRQRKTSIIDFDSIFKERDLGEVYSTTTRKSKLGHQVPDTIDEHVFYQCSIDKRGTEELKKKQHELGQKLAEQRGIRLDSEAMVSRPSNTSSVASSITAKYHSSQTPKVNSSSKMKQGLLATFSRMSSTKSLFGGGCQKPENDSSYDEKRRQLTEQRLGETTQINKSNSQYQSSQLLQGSAITMAQVFSPEQEHFFNEQLFQRLQEKRFQENKNKRLQKEYRPILRSVKFLKRVVEFWTKDYNQDCLDEKAMFNKDPRAFVQERSEFLKQYVETHMVHLRNYQPVFDKPEMPQRDLDAAGITAEMYVELAKQVFYINIYNGLIMFKLAEMVCFAPKSVFKLRSFASWLALEQNSRIQIAERSMSAYQIRLDVLKNVSGKAPNEFHVDPAHLHPLIDFALFMPKSGSIALCDLFFLDVSRLHRDFSRVVSLHLKPKIMVRADFNLQLLPCTLRYSLPRDDTDAPLTVLNRRLAQIEDLKERQKLANAPCILKKIKQEQTLNIIKFLQDNKMSCQNGNTKDMQLIEQQIEAGLKKYDNLLSRYNQGSVGRTAFIGNPGLAEYVIEFVPYEFNLHPRKVYDGLKSDFQNLLAKK